MYPNVEVKIFYLWSDGCSSQYKSKTSFYYLKKHTLPIERNFFGSEHGKNRCDAFTRQISTKYDNAVKSGEKVINNAIDMKEFLDDSYKNDPTKIFKLIEKGDQNLKAECQKFKNEQLKISM